MRAIIAAALMMFPTQASAAMVHGFLCESADDVKAILPLVQEADGQQSIDDFTAALPKSIKCSYTMHDVTFAGIEQASIGAFIYSIVHLKDTEGRDWYTWKKVNAI